MAKCDACHDKGWLHASNDGVHEIQRCDSCEMIVKDSYATRIHAATCGCNWVAGVIPGCPGPSKTDDFICHPGVCDQPKRDEFCPVCNEKSHDYDCR